MRLAIIGSTKFARPNAEQYVKEYIRAIFKKHGDRIEAVISGGAVGVDSWGREVAAEFGFTVENGTFIEHLPKVKRWEDGYKPRNMQIVNDATHVVAVRCQNAKTYGSGWTADRAEERHGKDFVHRHIVPAEV